MFCGKFQIKLFVPSKLKTIRESKSKANDVLKHQLKVFSSVFETNFGLNLLQKSVTTKKFSSSRFKIVNVFWFIQEKSLCQNEDLIIM